MNTPKLRILLLTTTVMTVLATGALAQQPAPPRPGPTPAPQPATPPQATPPQATPPQATPPPATPPAAQAPPGVPSGPPQIEGRPAAPTPAMPEWFAEMDADKDGFVSREEFVAVRMKLFDQLDANKDGALNKEEFTKLAEPPYTQDGPNVPPVEQRRRFYEAQFNQIDTNRDGKLTRDEVQVFVNVNFNEFDIDRDNRISEAELRMVLQQAEERRLRIEDERRRREEVRRDSGDMDRNGDGFIDLAEFLEFNLAQLAELDADKDGKITLQEYILIAGQPTDNPPNQPNYEQRKQIVTNRYREIDTNKDGVLVDAELRTFLTAVFKRLDLNGDGKISKE
ncbi:MAG TPA: EF-hand domain-containing protein, partial [Vineibacter sp.]|nr:EF-hand domain-containing protein [Vineibacter sp.]